jgi:hypothetical protein
VILGLVVLVPTACSGGDDDQATETTSTSELVAGQPAGAAAGSTTTAVSAGAVPCPDNRHAIVADIRLLVISVGELFLWGQNPGYDPLVRAGALELLHAYRDRGYEIVYITGWPSDTMIGGESVTELLPTWISDHGFPNGDGTSLHMWDPTDVQDENVFKTQVMVDLSAAGVQVDWVYTGDETDVQAYRNGGIGAERIYTFEAAAVAYPDTEPIPGDDLAAHLVSSVGRLGSVCPR